MEEVLKFLKEVETYYLGTINEGKPDIRPLGTITLYEGKLYIQTGKIKKVYKQLKENSNISICAFFNGKWIRINAKAIEDDRNEVSEAILNEYPSLKGLYSVGDGNCTSFYLKDAVATISSFTEPPKEYKF